MTCLILIILISNKWQVRYIPLNFSLIRQIPLIPKPFFLDLDLYITNDIVSSKMYDKQDDVNFEIVNFPFLDGDVPRSPSYDVYLFVLQKYVLMLVT